ERTTSNSPLTTQYSIPPERDTNSVQGAPAARHQRPGEANLRPTPHHSTLDTPGQETRKGPRQDQGPSDFRLPTSDLLFLVAGLVAGFSAFGHGDHHVAFGRFAF